jgi:hypothetical protein
MNTLTRSGIRYGVEFPKARAGERLDVLSWCIDTFGEPGFSKRWIALDYTIQFRDKRDRDWYILRWGV